MATVQRTAYEPYIFAALNSAKVMVVLGTKPEYFEAVWVRNEWSRFLELSKQNGNRTLIPAYKGMNPYDLPKEFSYLQAQDMSKIGFLQDLIAGIEKLLKDSRPAEAPAPTPSVPTAENKTGKNMPKKNIIVIAAIVAVVVAVVAIVAALSSGKPEAPSIQNSDSSVVITDAVGENTSPQSSAVSKAEKINLYHSFIKEHFPEEYIRIYDLDNNGSEELIVNVYKESVNGNGAEFSVYEIVEGTVTLMDKELMGYSTGLWLNDDTGAVTTLNYEEPYDTYMIQFVECDTEILIYSNGKITRKPGNTVQVPYATEFYVEGLSDLWGFNGADFDSISMIINNGYEEYRQYCFENFAM